MPPWVMPDTQAEEFEAACERIADVSWHKCKGVNHDLHNCPVISKQFEDDLDGNFWFCEAFEAVKIGVVDCRVTDFTECSSLQVITSDVATSKD